MSDKFEEEYYEEVDMRVSNETEVEEDNTKSFQEKLLSSSKLAALINKHAQNKNPNVAKDYIKMILELKDLSGGIDLKEGLQVTFPDEVSELSVEEWNEVQASDSTDR